MTYDAAYHKAYRAANKEKLAEQQRAWRLANPERVVEYNKTYHAENAETGYEQRRVRRAANIEQTRAESRRYEAVRRARQAEAFVEFVDPKVVWERDEGICHICNEAADINDWHLEHVVPLARGGDHSYANTAVSHPICNWKKGVK